MKWLCVILILLQMCFVLIGCKNKQIKVELEETQVVTSSHTVTVRETSLKWKQKMEKMSDMYVPITKDTTKKE